MTTATLEDTLRGHAVELIDAHQDLTFAIQDALDARYDLLGEPVSVYGVMSARVCRLTNSDGLIGALLDALATLNCATSVWAGDTREYLPVREIEQ